MDNSNKMAQDLREFSFSDGFLVLPDNLKTLITSAIDELTRQRSELKRLGDEVNTLDCEIDDMHEKISEIQGDW